MRGKIYRHDAAHGLLWIRTDAIDEDVICRMCELPKWLQPQQPQNERNAYTTSLLGTILEFELLHTPYYKRAAKVLVIREFDAANTLRAPKP